VNSAIEFSVADFPGYAEAVARENEIRGAACLGINETICGLEVKPLCAAHVRLLTLTRSPFLGRYPVEALLEKPGIENDILLFLWIVSPFYEAGSKTSAPRKWWQRKQKPTNRDKFNEAFAPVVKMDARKVIHDILEYVEDSYIDCDDSAPGVEKSFFSFEVSIAHEFHKHYGFRVDFWNNPPREQNPLYVPLKLVFQFRKLRAKVDGGEITNKSDRLVEASLESIGLKAREVKPVNQN
jgi:hypothetical protein